MQYPNIPAFITMYLIVYSYSYQKRYWSMKLLLVQYLMGIFRVTSHLGPRRVTSISRAGILSFALGGGGSCDILEGVCLSVEFCLFLVLFFRLCIFFTDGTIVNYHEFHPPKHGRTCHLFPSASFRVANPIRIWFVCHQGDRTRWGCFFETIRDPTHFVWKCLLKFRLVLVDVVMIDWSVMFYYFGSSLTSLENIYLLHLSSYMCFFNGKSW